MRKNILLVLLLLTIGTTAAVIHTINIGTVANDGTGDPLRTAMTKINSNFVNMNLALTNITVVSNTFALNVLVTNGSTFAHISQSFLMTATLTEYARVVLRVDQDANGTFEWAKTNQTGAGVAQADVEAFGDWLKPGAICYYTNESAGSATVAVSGGSGRLASGFGGAGSTSVDALTNSDTRAVRLSSLTVSNGAGTALLALSTPTGDTYANRLLFDQKNGAYTAGLDWNFAALTRWSADGASNTWTLSDGGGGNYLQAIRTLNALVVGNSTSKTTNAGNLAVNGTLYAATISGSGGPGLLQTDDGKFNTNVTAQNFIATNGISYWITNLTGVGGANTNFSLQAGQHVVINGFTNVSFRAIMGTTAGLEQPFSVTITNGSGSNRTLEFSPVTNAWHWSYAQGAPTVLTNGTALRLKGDTIGSNVFLAWAYYVFP